MSRFLGIDLTSSAKRRSTYALLDTKLSIISICDVRTDAAIIAAVKLYRPKLIAIDAPLSRPKRQQKGRLCEMELRNRDIPSFPTTKKSFIKPLIRRGIRLKKELENLRFNVIEIYPYASTVTLWGKPPYKKKTPDGLKWLRRQVTTKIPEISELKSFGKLNRDECDAVIAAYTAYLHHQGKTEPIGDKAEGLIHIPSSK